MNDDEEGDDQDGSVEFMVTIVIAKRVLMAMTIMMVMVMAMSIRLLQIHRPLIFTYVDGKLAAIGLGDGNHRCFRSSFRCSAE